LDEKNKSAELKIASDQFSLAIGRRGENIRLASRLTGWKINIIEDKDDVSEEQQEISSDNYIKDEEKDDSEAKNVEVKEEEEEVKEDKKSEKKDEEKEKKEDKKDKKDKKEKKKESSKDSKEDKKEEKK
jgi:hypothetical protein